MSKFYKLVVVIAALCLPAAFAGGADLDKPLVSGVIEANVLTATNTGEALFTRSVSLVRVDTEEQVLCLEGDGLGGEILIGPTSPIVNLGSDVFIEGYSHSEAGCVGFVSDASIDRYKVVFLRPDAPILRVVSQ